MLPKRIKFLSSIKRGMTFDQPSSKDADLIISSRGVVTFRSFHCCHFSILLCELRHSRRKYGFRLAQLTPQSVSKSDLRICTPTKPLPVQLCSTPTIELITCIIAKQTEAVLLPRYMMPIRQVISRILYAIMVLTTTSNRLQHLASPCCLPPKAVKVDGYLCSVLHGNGHLCSLPLPSALRTLHSVMWFTIEWCQPECPDFPPVRQHNSLVSTRLLQR